MVPHQTEVIPIHFITLVLFGDELLLRAKFPSSEAGPSDTPNSAFSLRFAVYTAAACCGCYRRHEGATSGIARWFRVEWWLRVARWQASLAGVAASLAGVAGGRRWRSPQKDRPVPLRQLKHPTLPSTENSAQRTASGGGTRVTPQPSAEKTPP